MRVPCPPDLVKGPDPAGRGCHDVHVHDPQVEPTAENTRATRILDADHPDVARLAGPAPVPAPATDPALDLATAHVRVGAAVQAAYTLDERRPASRTLALGRGSCSQRFAVLEAVARAGGTPTRTHGLAVDGRFWHRRFPRWRAFVPGVVLLAWPEFSVDGRWAPVQDLLGAACGDACGPAFANDGPETLFDASARPGAVDLGPWVVADLGRYASRDAFFDAQGQTFCAPARVVVETVLR